MKYSLRMNLLKYAFGFSFDKVLGFTIHRKGINLDPAKAKAIQDMEPVKTVKTVEELFKENFLKDSFQL